MAIPSLTNESHIIDPAILEDIVTSVNPELIEGPDFDSLIEISCAIIKPHINALAAAYRAACSTDIGGAAARHFLTHLLEAEA